MTAGGRGRENLARGSLLGVAMHGEMLRAEITQPRTRRLDAQLRKNPAPEFGPRVPAVMKRVDHVTAEDAGDIAYETQPRTRRLDAVGLQHFFHGLGHMASYYRQRERHQFFARELSRLLPPSTTFMLLERFAHCCLAVLVNQIVDIPLEHRLAGERFDTSLGLAAAMVHLPLGDGHSACPPRPAASASGHDRLSAG